eukprot:CAMPEP_0113497042 /NCGR_PEP_ID=MMETSP0014_2-20120614/30429_1 /TAXON_ID=2857 /ORGANISM="Nitzschia sp." /LENGTH=794 /DNA_ID=CAMNT_0000390975 /DNA_START=360 /DNA_END=2744 /DNA_ORIENTATION=- /assembly_acc=CAM_ASM_000159
MVTMFMIVVVTMLVVNVHVIQQIDGYIPWGRRSSSYMKSKTYQIQHHHHHQQQQPFTVRTRLGMGVDDEEEEQQQQEDSSKPQPPDTPPPAAYFAAPIEMTDSADAEAESAAAAAAAAEAKAAAEAAEAEAEEARRKKEKEEKEEEAKRQAEVAAQMLFEAEEKAKRDEEERLAREEENRRRQEAFLEWTNQFIEEYITPVTDIEKGVSSDRIKGAALTGAALGLLAGNGVGAVGAAGLTAAYLSISKGTAGDVFRSVGGVAWDAADTSWRLLKILESPTNKLTTALSDRAKDVLSKVQVRQDSMTNSSFDEIRDIDQVTQEYLDLTTVLKEAEAVIGEADAAIAKAQEEEQQAEEKISGEVDLSIPYDAAAVLAYQESDVDTSGMDYDEIVQNLSFLSFKSSWKQRSVADVIAKKLEKEATLEAEKLAEEEAQRLEAERLAEEERLARLEEEVERIEAERLAEEEEMTLLEVEETEESPEDNEDEPGEYFMDEEEGEWTAAVELAQEGLDGKIVGIEEMVADNNAKAQWDAAGALARELNDDEDDDEADDEDELFDEDFGEEIDFENLDMEALGKAARDAVAAFENEFEDDAQLREEQKQEWANSMVTDDIIDEDEDEEDDELPSMGGGITADYESMKKSELQDLLRARGLKTSGNKGDLIHMLQRDDMSRPISVNGAGTEIESEDEMFDVVDSDTDMDLDTDIEMDEIDLEELGRQARAAVQMFETRSLDEDIEEPTEEMLAEIEDEIATLAVDSINFSDMTVSELKEECRKRGLKVSGRKAELIERLESAS